MLHSLQELYICNIDDAARIAALQQCKTGAKSTGIIISRKNFDATHFSDIEFIPCFSDQQISSATQYIKKEWLPQHLSLLLDDGIFSKKRFAYRLELFKGITAGTIALEIKTQEPLTPYTPRIVTNCFENLLALIIFLSKNSGKKFILVNSSNLSHYALITEMQKSMLYKYTETPFNNLKKMLCLPRQQLITADMLIVYKELMASIRKEVYNSTKLSKRPLPTIEAANPTAKRRKHPITIKE